MKDVSELVNVAESAEILSVGGGTNGSLTEGTRAGAVRQLGGRKCRGVAVQRSIDRQVNAALALKNHARKRAVGRLGVDRVLQFEAERGRLSKPMPPRHEGYDVESSNADGVIERIIEIKSLEGAWTAAGVSLTKPQFERARQLGPQYWLYVVEHTLDDKRCRIHTIQDPYGQASRFVFDPGWCQMDEVHSR